MNIPFSSAQSNITMKTEQTEGTQDYTDYDSEISDSELGGDGVTELFDFEDNDSIAETMTEIASIMRTHSMTFQHFKEAMFRKVS